MLSLTLVISALFLHSPPVVGSPISDAKLIVGGVPVSPKFKYSWLVSLESKFSGSHYCGGTLLNPTTVITAAHCSVNTRAYLQRAVAHRYDLRSSLSEEKALVFNVESITVHPGYDDKLVANDVAIWKVKLSSGDSSLIPSVVSLDDGSTSVADNTTVIVSGWGTTSSSPQGKMSPILLETEVEIFDQEECKKEYSDLDPSSICAAAPGRDTCQGDSGGPLFAVSDDGMVKIIGLTSYGNGCADPAFAGVYSRVSSLYSWIKTTANL